MKRRHGADRVKHAISWPSDCAHVAAYHERTFEYADSWPRLVDYARIACEYTGPTVFYGRFRSADNLRSVLATSPPREDYCVYGAEFVTDGLDDAAEFRRMCDKLGGRLR